MLYFAEENYHQFDSRTFAIKLNEITRGWMNYFAMAKNREDFVAVDEWFENLINQKDA